VIHTRNQVSPNKYISGFLFFWIVGLGALCAYFMKRGYSRHIVSFRHVTLWTHPLQDIVHSQGYWSPHSFNLPIDTGWHHEFSVRKRCHHSCLYVLLIVSSFRVMVLANVLNVVIFVVRRFHFQWGIDTFKHYSYRPLLPSSRG